METGFAGRRPVEELVGTEAAPVPAGAVLHKPPRP
jgi:hypothetical protein